MRCRCKVVLALVPGKTPTMIVQGGLCTKSLDLDEVDIHFNPKIGPGWMRRGRQKTVLTPGCNPKRDLAGAWNPKTRRLIYVEGERKNSLWFLKLLYKLATKTYPDAKRSDLKRFFRAGRSSEPFRQGWSRLRQAEISDAAGHQNHQDAPSDRDRVLLLMGVRTSR
jgi:hypothetical protein